VLSRLQRNPRDRREKLEDEEDCAEEEVARYCERRSLSRKNRIKKTDSIECVHWRGKREERGKHDPIEFVIEGRRKHDPIEFVIEGRGIAQIERVHGDSAEREVATARGRVEGEKRRANREIGRAFYERWFR